VVLKKFDLPAFKPFTLFSIHSYRGTPKMFKEILLPATFVCMSFSAISQTAPAIDKALRDPKRTESEAKADVYLHKQHVIADSLPPAPAPVTTLEKRKKKNCKRKPNA
jgi:hypothetical protein